MQPVAGDEGENAPVKPSTPVKFPDTDNKDEFRDPKAQDLRNFLQIDAFMNAPRIRVFE